MKCYYIAIENKKRNTAGAKAPDDINEICRRRGMEAFFMPAFPHGESVIKKKIWLATVANRYWKKLQHTVDEGDIILYQHPMYGYHIIKKYMTILKKKKCKFVALVHDLESLRKGIEGVLSVKSTTSNFADLRLLKDFDCVICHNEHMKKYLINQGFDSSKIVCLEIFDYLTDFECKQNVWSSELSIAIAGNLAKGKCGYIYKMYKDTQNEYNSGLITNLYGISFEVENRSLGMDYHGSFKPEELPSHLHGKFGLVWDGPEASSCTGNTGEYLKYNNPHKTSLYLASKMPVIVWNQAAIADFVLRNRVGITVNNLYELEKVISSVSEEEYEEMCKNVEKISQKLRDGYFFNEAMKNALEKIR